MQEKKIPLQIPAVLDKYQSFSKGDIKLQFLTRENLNADELLQMIKMQNKPGYLTFNVEQIEAVDLLPIIGKKIDKSKYEGKTPSQRLRSVFYLIWNKLPNPKDHFDIFYDRKMNDLIEYYKEKLSGMDE